MDENNLNADQPAVSRPGSGALVGAIIVILLLALGGFYFWGARLNGENNPPPLILGNDTASAEIPNDASDEAIAIAEDVQAMNVDQINSQANESMTAFVAETQ